MLVGALGTREGDKTLHSCPKMTPTGNAKRWISARIIWSNPFSLTETVILTLFVYLIPNIGRKRHGPAFMSNSYLPARHVTKRPYFDESPVTVCVYETHTSINILLYLEQNSILFH